MTLSVKCRILVFFASNPDAQMTTTELMRKFGASRQALLQACSELEEEGAVALVREKGRAGAYSLLWSVGPALLEEI